MGIKIISDDEAIYNILLEKDMYTCYLGAGASAEADVMTAAGICEEIREKLIKFELNNNPDLEDATKKIDARLKWADKSKRYSMCMRLGYNTQDRRVTYFRNLLKDKAPSFCHHAVALLMGSQHFRSTCLTTNFDKLLEMAFMQQGKLACQAIRTEAEIKYWSPNKRPYMIKLHGDYDTDNVLNTAHELRIKDDLKQAVRALSREAGMVVLGSAGNEWSVRTLFEYLTDDESQDEKVLSNGLFWGVYMNQSRPKEILSERDLDDLVKRRIEEGEVGDGIVEMMARTSKRDEPFCFFPVWGAGNFLFRLIKAVKDKELEGTAQLYLDPEMRLWDVFERAKLEEAAISKHIAALHARKKKLESNAERTEIRRKPKAIFKAQDKQGRIEIRGIYGDITSRSMMSDGEFRNVGRAVVSPEDTCLSAGGGVAQGLLKKAGPFTILNELQKFSPIAHKAVAVTSGGNLPVHHIFHAASIEIQRDGEYLVSEDAISETMREVLNKATALLVGALWIPLMGTGVGPLKERQSLTAILKAIAGWENKEHRLTITIVLFDEEHLLPNRVIECVNATVGSTFEVESLYPL